MYELFSRPQVIKSPEITPGEWDYLKRMYEAEISKIVTYFQNRVLSVKSEHLLCRMINTLMVPIHYDDQRFYTATDARAEFIARHFNMTSSIGPGRLFDGVFYGEGVQEILLLDNDPFSMYDLNTNWRDIQAVKVLSHPVSSTNLMVPNGNVHSTETGRAVISIHLTKLMAQFRAFTLDQIRRHETEGKGMLSVRHFVAMYVLPNMLYTHTDQVIWNRLANLINYAPMGESLRSYVFPIRNMDDKLDKCLLKITKHLRNRQMDFSGYLSNMPAVFAEDQLAALAMPDMAPTRQVWWAMYLTRLPVIETLLEIGDHRGRISNLTHINRMKVQISRLLDENVFVRHFEKHQAQEIEDRLERLEAY